MKGLQPSTKYLFRIAASAGDAEGPTTPWAAVTTDQYSMRIGVCCMRPPVTARTYARTYARLVCLQVGVWFVHVDIHFACLVLALQV